MALPPQKPAQNIPIEIPQDLQPAYANLARIAHAPAEFVIDFARTPAGGFQSPRDSAGCHVSNRIEIVRSSGQREPGTIRKQFRYG